jgi:hypothetical protein
MLQYLPWIIAALALASLAAGLAVWLRMTRRPAPSGPPPLPTEWDLLPRPVFSADERRLYRQLREAFPHHMVLAKLPLVRFCQPAAPQQVRYWYELLGAIHVGFAVCSANGRVLAAIDLNYERTGPPGRATRIKQSVLGACRVRYLRCAPDHLPSVPELQLLVPQATHASRGPQPAAAIGPLPAAMSPLGASTHAAPSRRRERTALWQDSGAFVDSFFRADRVFETAPDALPPATVEPPPDADFGAMPSPSPTRH